MFYPQENKINKTYFTEKIPYQSDVYVFLNPTSSFIDQ